MTDQRASGRNDIAIVGMSCLFPGSANVDEFWRNILGGEDMITDPPPDAWDVDAYYSEGFADEDKTYCKRGGYLGDLARFDPLLHGIPPVSVGGEPDQWLSLQLAHDALADADALSLPPEIRRKTGMILGKGTYLNGGNAIAVQRGLIVEQTIGLLRQLQPELGEDKLEALRQGMKDALPPIGPETVAGLIPNIIVGRVANRLDLMGPAYTVDAACASSLLAVQLAQRHLLDGDCDLMIAGGAQVWMPVPTLNVFSHLGALSKTQTIRPFDKNADGTLLGEGIGMVVLKRAADALRDGDRIYSIVKGVGVASDGKGTHVMAPRQEGEETALRRAYEAAGVDPATIGLIEAHGTATPVGDVVELQALGEVFGKRTAPLPHVAIGTVKSMISHTIPASGVAGIIKTSLALHHKVLPPTLNVTEPNPKLELDTSCFYINTQTRPWIHGAETPRRAGVNSFGFGGINAHAILEEAPDAVRVDHRPAWDTELVVLEAATTEALVDATRALLAEVETIIESTAPAEPKGLTELAAARAAQLGAIENPVRLAVVAPSFDGLATKLRKALDKFDKGTETIKDVSGIYHAAQPLAREGEVVLLFPGEGAQYAGMLSELCLHFPEVREAFDQMDRIFDGHDRQRRSSDWIFPRPAFDDETRKANDAELMEMDMAVEAVLTGNRAMHKLLERLGVGWDVVVGHSTGEYSAAEAAGVLTVSDDERAAIARGLYACYAGAGDLENLPKAVLIAIGADRETVDAIGREAGGRIMVAMDNCKHQVVLVAEPEAAERARAILDRESLVYEVLPFDRAVHTPDFQAYADSLRPVFDPIEVHAPTRPIVTSTTGDRYPEDLGEIRNLLSDHWTSPVEFTRTIEKLHERGARVFVECGPRGNLSAFIDDILRGERFVTITPDKSRRNGVTQLNHFVGQLLAHGVPVDVEQLFVGRVSDEPVDNTPRKAPIVALSTPWPMLRLPESVVAEVRSGAAAAATPTNGTDLREPQAAPTGPAAAPTPGPSATPGNGHASGNGGGNGATQAPPRPAAPTVGAPTASPSPTAAPAQPVHGGALVGSIVERPFAGAPAAPSEAVLTEHFTRMSQFLTLETEVMKARFGGTLPTSPLSGALPGMAPAGAPAAPATPSVHPFVGEVVHHVPGKTITTRRAYDAENDLFLQDHRMGHALAVMPLTMSLAIAAQVAQTLAPELSVTGLRNAFGRRWLAVGDEPTVIEVTARRSASGAPDGSVSVEVEITNLTEAQGRTTRPEPVVAATVMLGHRTDAPPAPRAPLPDTTTSRWRDEDLYTEVMFHGPRWQGVTHLTATAPTGLTADMTVLPLDTFQRTVAVPPMAIDPIVLDAVGQLIGFWTAEHLDHAKVVFPFLVERLDIFGTDPGTGTALTGRADITLDGDQRVRADLDVLGADGSVWIRIEGWNDKRFDVPAAFLSLVSSSSDGELSVEWPEPAAALGHNSPVQCRHIRTAFPSDVELWRRVWSHRVLSRRERAALEARKVPESLLLEQLGARTSAKEAVRLLAREHLGLELDLQEIEIIPDEHGRPTVQGAWLAGVRAELVPHVSIAHSGGHAVALVSLGTPVGVDVETVRKLADGFVETGFAAEDLPLLGSLPTTDDDEWILRCWCAKEAVAKGLGSGLGHSPHALRITDVDTDTGRIVVTLTRELVEGQAAWVGVPLVSQTLREEGHIVAITTCSTTGGGPR